MGAGLDPKANAAAKFQQDYAYREAFARKANYIEPPFPYKLLPFDPVVYELDRVVLPDEEIEQ